MLPDGEKQNAALVSPPLVSDQKRLPAILTAFSEDVPLAIHYFSQAILALCHLGTSGCMGSLLFLSGWLW